MHVHAKRIIGSACIALGIFFLLVSASSFLTGAVIGERGSSVAVSIGGLAFIVAGIVLFSSGDEREAYETRESRLAKLAGGRYERLSEHEQITYNKALRRHDGAVERRNLHALAGKSENPLPRIIKTMRFEKAIRNHDEAAIERAIRKIGTGLGKEEKLKHDAAYSIRVSKGGRIIYDRRDDGTVVLEDYLPAHQYARR